MCEEEVCGDGFHDLNGPDNIWLTTDDEQCDDGNDIDDDDCANDCTLNTPNPVDGVCHDYGEQYAFAGDGSNAPDL